MPRPSYERPKPELPVPPTITFLQFVCARLIGPPAMHGARMGESYWHCPWCKRGKEPKFHTLPHDGRRDYWKCYRCEQFGDELQLLRNLRAIGHPIAVGDYPAHQALLALWRDEFLQKKFNGSTVGDLGKNARLPGLLNSPTVEPLNGSPDNVTAELAFAKLTDAQVVQLAEAVALARLRCRDADGLLWYCFHSVRKIVEAKAMVGKLKGRR